MGLLDSQGENAADDVGGDGVNLKGNYGDGELGNHND